MGGRVQTLVQLTDDLLAALDERAVATGRSRSDLVRQSIERFLREDTEAGIDRAIVDGYALRPQEPDPWVEVVAKDSIAAEPW